MSANQPLVPPPGTQITDVNCITLDAQIGFNDTESGSLLPPLAQVAWSGSVRENDLTLIISTVIFIDKNLGVTSGSINVYWNESHLQPLFYIDYSAPDEITNEYQAYQVNFTIGYSNHTEEIPTRVETFVWDEDPEGSRGTLTTVKPPTT